jgi:hypothetical protein
VACFVPAVGVTFDVLVDGEASTAQTTGEAGEIAVPVGAEPATYLINNQPNPGLSEPEVSCTITRADGSVEQVGGAIPAGSPGQEITFDATSEVTCTFYFLGEVEPGAAGLGDAPGAPELPDEPVPPAADGGEADAGNTSAGDTGLSVRALRCPPEAAGMDEVPEGLCAEPASGLTFEILVDGALIGTSVSDAAGDLAIPAGAGAGMYLFRHQPAPDLLEMITECSSVYANGNTATGRSNAVGSQMSEIYLSYDDASRVTCTFYFVMETAVPPTGDTAAADQAAEDGSVPEGGNATGHTLTLQFWTCPEGVDAAADRDALTQTCSVETTDRSLMLTIDGLTTGETMTGAATWEFDASPVAADIGAGVSSSAWCESSWSGGDESAAETQDAVSLEGGALTVTVTHSATKVSCDWFIFPT